MVVDQVKLREYLKQDRYWKREQRIAHAQWQLNKAENEQDKEFWQAVIDANTQ